MDKTEKLTDKHHARPLEGGYSLLLAGFFACVSCAVFNVLVTQNRQTASVPSYSISNVKCILKKDQHWFHHSLPHESYKPADKRSEWKTVENNNMYEPLGRRLAHQGGFNPSPR